MGERQLIDIMKDIDLFYLDKKEPVKSCLLALKSIICNYNKDFIPEWKYRLPCFTYKNQIFCYLWVDKKTQFPYFHSVNEVYSRKSTGFLVGRRWWTVRGTHIEGGGPSPDGPARKQPPDPWHRGAGGPGHCSDDAQHGDRVRCCW